MKRILVTGAGGFIGTHLVHYLKEQGHFVRGADLKLPSWSVTQADEFWLLDLCDLLNAQMAVMGMDQVYALAADMGGIGYISDPEQQASIMYNNTMVNFSTLEAARRMGVRRYLLTSSVCVYPVHRLTEERVAPLQEHEVYPARPQKSYGWEKLQAEHLCQYYQAYGMETRIVRLQNTYGPCFDDQTEILTVDGWKLFTDLNYNDFVATLNPDHIVEYHHPEVIQRHPHDGKMYRAQGHYVNMMITPDHQVYFAKPHDKTFRLGRAQDIWSGGLIIPTAATWEDTEPRKWFILPDARHVDGRLHYKNRRRRIPMKSWLEFLGWYLSEGCCFQTPNSYRVCITQYNRENRNRIMQNIFDMGFSCRINDSRNIMITSKQLYNYCKQFGHAKDKYIPREFLELPPSQLVILFDALMAGDGDADRNRYSTISHQLADDFQEIALKLGYSVFITEDNESVYRVRFRRAKVAHVRDCNRSLVSYKGMVYDVTVPNHVILVRRNGKAYWSGNCGTWRGGREKAPAALCRKIAQAKLSGNHQVTVWGDGKVTRSFMYVGDCVRGLYALMESDYHEPVTLGPDEVTTIDQLVDAIAQIAGIEVEKVYVEGPQGVRGRNFDHTRARALGWQPHVSFEQGLKITYDWVERQVRKL